MFCNYTCQGNLRCLPSKIEHFDQYKSSYPMIMQEYKSSYPIIMQEYKSSYPMIMQEYKSSYPMIMQEYKSYPHYEFGMGSFRMKSFVNQYLKTLPIPSSSKVMSMDKSKF